MHACQANQRMVEGAAQAYIEAGEGPLTDLAGSAWEARLVPGYMVDMPACPTEGGSYRLDGLGQATCDDDIHPYYGD
jgi:hypothetical protein